MPSALLLVRFKHAPFLVHAFRNFETGAVALVGGTSELQSLNRFLD